MQEKGTTMRQGKDAPGWPPKPWTIQLVGVSGNGPRGGGAAWWQAINLETRETKPARPSYDAAMKDIPGQGPHAEPWGV